METVTKTIYSANAEEYPNLDVECKVVEDMEAYANGLIEDMKQNGQKPGKARKTAIVDARAGVLGEEVDTRVRVSVDDKLYFLSETKNIVKNGNSMIVTNPDGEQYIVKGEKFGTKYEKTENEGKYRPLGGDIDYIIAPENIVFQASWGEEMTALKGAALNVSDLKDIYAIQNTAFESTYTAKQSSMSQDKEESLENSK